MNRSLRIHEASGKIQESGSASCAHPKIDIYNHVLPTAYLELLKKRYKDSGMVKRLASARMLWDMEARVDMLKQWPELQQILTLANPPPEVFCAPRGFPSCGPPCERWAGRYLP